MALVAYYPLNGDANDYSGNELHGTATNVTWTDGKVGQAGSFNGTTAYISRASVTGFPTGNVTATISAWVYYRTFDNDWEGITGWGNRGTSTACMLSTNNGRPALNTWGLLGAQDILADNPISLNSWNHIVGTIQNRNIKLYVNGSLVKEGTITATPNVAAVNFTIGSLDYPGRYSDANIDEVRIYDDVLSQFEIRELALFHPSANLVAHYPLDGDLLDYSGNNLHIDSNTAIYNPNGKIKGSYTYGSGKTSCKTTGFTLGPTSTVTAWGKSSNYSNTMLFSLNVASGPDLYFAAGAISWNMGDGAANPFKDDSGVNLEYPSLNEWHHYAVVTDASKNKTYLYIDGSYRGSASYRTTEQTNKAFTIGNYIPGSTAYSWNGDIDDVRVYSKALSESEIKSLAQAKVAHYKLEDKIEQATQNLCYDLSLDYYDKSRFFSTDGDGFTEVMYLGKKWMRYDSGNRRLASIPIAANTVYTWSLKIISPSASSISFVQWDGNGYGWATYPISSGYNEVSHTFTSEADSTYEILHLGSFPVNSLLADFQLEQRSYATPITKGTRTGAIIKDSTYNQNHGSVTLTTSPAWSSDTAVGLGSMQFDGIDDFINLTALKNANFNTGITFSVYAKPTASSNWARFIDFGNGPSSDNLLFTRAGTTTTLALHSYNGATSSSITAANAIENNIWQHFAFTISSTGAAKIYKNGLVIASGNLSTPNIITRENMYIGRSNWVADSYYTGFMSDIQIFATALSDQDVYNLYVSKSKSIKFSSSSTSKIILDNTKTGTVKSKITK